MLSMIKKTLILALRNIKKHPNHSLINILGLAIGLATFILIFFYVQHEKSYDDFHPQAENTFRVINGTRLQDVGEVSTSSPFPLMRAMQTDYDNQIKHIGRVFNNWSSEYFIEYGERGFKEKKFFFADSSILDIFNIEFVVGNPSTSLRKPLTVLLTESAAKKYFGDENPIGKEIKFEERFHFVVSGIIKDAADNTHFKYEMLASMSTLKVFYGGQLPTTWYWNPFWTYVVLNKEVHSETMNDLFPEFVEKYFPEGQRERKKLYLQPVQDIHLHSHLDFEIENNASYSAIVILTTFAVFMLIIAIINFMNLSTATAASRAKEVGIKKVLGSQKNQLVVQFLIESVIMACIALVIAILIIDQIMPLFNDFMGISLKKSIVFSFESFLAMGILTIITGILAGFYPAVFLAQYSPAKVLKGNVSRGMKSGNARKLLVTFQFAVAIALIIGTSMAYIQMKFLRNADLGFNKDHVIILPVQRTPIAAKYDAFEAELLKHPSISHVTSTEYVPGTDHNSHEFKPEGFPDTEWQFYPTLIVREGFLDFFDVPIVAGRDYNKSNSTDKDKAILINEAMVEFMGWESNEEAIGKRFQSLRGDERVVGVFRNFNIKSLHSEKTPLVLNMKEGENEIRYYTTFIVVRYIGDDPTEVIAYLEMKWKEFAPSRPFEYSFHKEAIAKLYHNESRLGRMALIFTSLIIFIAMLGLLGLVSFMTNQRTREIGIRRTLGASVFSIIRLISREFLLLIGVSSVIAWPVIYWVLTNWLNTFAYHTDIYFWVFAAALSVALMIAFIITMIKGYAVSKRNLIDTIRYE